MKKMNAYSRQILMFSVIATLAIFASCDTTKDPDPQGSDPIASFEFAVDEVDFLKVTFTNFSQNATSYAWDFGDNTGTSTDKDPVYTYAAAGNYSVVLTATNADGVSATKTLALALTDPVAAGGILTGTSSKVWQLLADPTGGNAYEIVPEDRSQVWFSLGGNGGGDVAKLCVRECVMDDTWTFKTDGTYTFENNGDFWAEGGIWATPGCFDATVASNWFGINNQDLNGWNSGTHNYTYDAIAGTLTVTGGFIGLAKAATNEEVTAPAVSVTYTVVKLIDAAVDTLIIETTVPAVGGIWRATLVSYDNVADKIVIGECEDTGGGTTIDEVNIDLESSIAFDVFGGAITYSAVANPVSGGINTSSTVGQVDQVAGVEGWAGIATGLAGKVDFSTKNTFKMKVYSPAVGQVIKFKLEETGNGGNNKEVDATTTVANTWEELTFTFSGDDSGKWDRMALFFDFQGAAKSGGSVHYFDDIVLVSGGAVFDVVDINFESTIDFDVFGGTLTYATVANPFSGGINTSANVGKIEQEAGVEGWAGIATGLAGKVDFSTKTTFKMKVYSPAVGQVIKFKLEDAANGGNNKEVDATTTVANAWEELTFTFTADDSGKWDRMALFFDFQGALKANASVHYFDDIVLQ